MLITVLSGFIFVAPLLAFALYSVSRQLCLGFRPELGKMLVDEIKDPRVGFATVTEVRLSGDLRNARVYVSVYGSNTEREASLAAVYARMGGE